VSPAGAFVNSPHNVDSGCDLLSLALSSHAETFARLAGTRVGSFDTDACGVLLRMKLLATSES
jgi:hypothetical protein